MSSNDLDGEGYFPAATSQCSYCHGTGKALVEITERLVEQPPNHWEPIDDPITKDGQKIVFGIGGPGHDADEFPLPLPLGSHVVAEEWLWNQHGKWLKLPREQIKNTIKREPPSTMPESLAAQCQWRLVVVATAAVKYGVLWQDDSIGLCWHQTAKCYYERNEG